MARFILIDNGSGFIWGDSATHYRDWNDPIAYARHLDASVGEHGRDYMRTAKHDLTSNETGYHVFEAPTEFPHVDDGQDQEMIDRVEAECTPVCTIRVLAAA